MPIKGGKGTKESINIDTAHGNDLILNALIDLNFVYKDALLLNVSQATGTGTGSNGSDNSGADTDQLNQLERCKHVEEKEEAEQNKQTTKDDTITDKQKSILTQICNGGLKVWKNHYLKDGTVNQKQLKENFKRIGREREMGSDVYMLANECTPLHQRIYDLDGYGYSCNGEPPKKVGINGIDGIFVDKDGYTIYIVETKSTKSKLGVAQNKRVVAEAKKQQKKNEKKSFAYDDLTPEEKLVYYSNQLDNQWIYQRIGQTVEPDCADQIANRIEAGIVYVFLFRMRREKGKYHITIESSRRLTLNQNEKEDFKLDLSEQKIQWESKK